MRLNCSIIIAFHPPPKILRGLRALKPFSHKTSLTVAASPTTQNLIPSINHNLSLIAPSNCPFCPHRDLRRLCPIALNVCPCVWSVNALGSPFIAQIRVMSTLCAICLFLGRLIGLRFLVFWLFICLFSVIFWFHWWIIGF